MKDEKASGKFALAFFAAPKQAGRDGITVGRAVKGEGTWPEPAGGPARLAGLDPAPTGCGRGGQCVW